MDQSNQDATQQGEGPLPERAGVPHPRLLRLPRVRVVQDGVVPRALCEELLFAYKAVSTVGYRPHVRSATIHDVATTAPWLLPPLLAARSAAVRAVESAFGLALELCVEFSGLIGWQGGASLGWHHDANRSYLSSRHMSCVLYLNNQGEDFGEGDFRFQDGPEPLRVAPRAGRLVAYTADARNVHCVEPVAWGERVTLTLWFSLEPAAAEDGKVLEQLCRLGLAAPASQAQQPPLPQEVPEQQQRDQQGPTCQPSAASASGEREAKRPRLDAAAPGLDAAAAVQDEEGQLGAQPEGPGLLRISLGGALLPGPGLPDAMYGLPGEEGGDLRLQRLRQLGLCAVVQEGLQRVGNDPAPLPPQVAPGGCPGSGSGAGAAGEGSGAAAVQQQAVLEDGGTGRVRSDTAGLAEAEPPDGPGGAACGAGAQQPAVWVWSGQGRGASAGAPAASSTASCDRQPGSRRGSLATAQCGRADGARAGAWGRAPGPDAPGDTRRLCFSSLREASLVAHYAAHQARMQRGEAGGAGRALPLGGVGSGGEQVGVEQLVRAVEGLRGAARRGLELVRGRLGAWQELGSMVEE